MIAPLSPRLTSTPHDLNIETRKTMSLGGGAAMAMSAADKSFCNA